MKYVLSNFSEVMVKKMLEEYLSKTDIPCKCDRCQADIMALALNRLPPRYFVSPKGEVLTNFESHLLPDKARVITEVVSAAKIVSEYPSHNIDDK